MKKIFTILLFSGMLLISSCSFAAVDGSKIALSGIYPGMSATDLVNTVGQPQSKYDDHWVYGNFKVEIEHGIFEKISTRSSAIATPNGVCVGQAATALNSTYGQADKLDHEYAETEYEYYSTDGSKKIEFTVQNGVIVKISCKIHD